MSHGPVVHVVVAGEVGGAERMLVDLVRAQTARRHTVALFTPSERLRALFVDAGLDVDERSPVRETPLSYLARSLGPRDAAWLAAVLTKRDAAIAHLHTFGSQVVGTRAARRVGAKVVRTEHSTRVYDDPSCWPFSRWSLTRADAVVCISSHVSRVALAKAPWVAPWVHVVTNGVDTVHFAPRPNEPRTALASSEVVTGGGAAGGVVAARSVRFVSLGRLDPRKGLDVALEALALVPHAELDIVGDGEQRTALGARAKQLGVDGRVRFVGYVGDVRNAVESADIALSSARAEGLGVALLEAMAMGKPVVALPTGGIPEIVTDGDTGWLAHGHSASALARAMQDAIDHPEEVRRRGGRAHDAVTDRFSVAVMARAYERIYDSL